ncbi:hypothetical protein crov372 [Cafeteria roenbergensis virus]|uniref:Uncharacterized protein n=1 Tax=Cafeteria roenbergensis virus (strain BV-PW1) TaxID=693272 RepID=E3T5E3_CROVB|nr:hypothetical protein crov372 [Cafeteria roenbergensis virus BV-PW1]ADO67406.1 hypothetical protein crov372 [Cafeteria roenbergensis virus BV-PW1]
MPMNTSKQSNTVKQLITSLDNFEPSRLTIKDFQEGKGVGPKMAFLRYNHPSLGEDTSLMLQTPWITLTSGGIPRYNEQYHKNDKDRAYLRLPLEEGTDFFNKITALDEQFSSDEFKKEKFGKLYKKYSMYPCVKITEQEEGDTRDPLPPSLKLRFSLVWNEEDKDACEINTQVFTSKMEDGKRTRTPVPVSSLKDMESLVRLGAKLRLIVRPVSAWMNPKKEYGIKWKIQKMEVEPSTAGNALMKEFYETDAFIDSDDEEDVELPPSATGKKTSTKTTKEDDEDEDDDDDDDDDDVGEKSEDSDEASDEESDEESDEDSEEDSPDIPVRKSKGKGKSKGLDL